MESIAKLIVIIGLAYLLMTCSAMQKIPAASDTNDRSKSSGVTAKHFTVSFNQLKRVGRAFNAAGQPTAFILLSSDNGNFLDIYLLRSIIKEGYSIQSPGLPSEVEVRAHWNGIQFAQSAVHLTQVNFSIQSLTPTEVVIDISATLFHSATGAYLEVASSRISVSGEHLKELVGEI